MGVGRVPSGSRTKEMISAPSSDAGVRVNTTKS